MRSSTESGSCAKIVSPYSEPPGERAVYRSSVINDLDLTHEMLHSKLVQKYCEHGCLPLLFNDRVMPIDEAYNVIGLKCLSSKDAYSGASQHNNIIASVDDIFSGSMPESYHTVIQGRPGLGKSSLARYIAYRVMHDIYRHKNNTTRTFKGFYGVFVIPLKLLDIREFRLRETFEDFKGTAEEGWLIEFLLKHILNSLDVSWNEGQLSKQANDLLAALKDDRYDYLFILDGYDELPSRLTEHAQSVLDQLLDMKYWTILTRPNQMDTTLLNDVLRDAAAEGTPRAAIFELQHFDQAMIERYIDSFFGSDSVQRLLEQMSGESGRSLDPQEVKSKLLQLLNRSSGLLDLCKIPICLELLCYVALEPSINITGSQDLTEAVLYCRILSFLESRGVSAQGHNPNDYNMHQLFRHFKNALIAIQNIAFTQIKLKSKLILAEDLNDILDRHDISEDGFYDLSLFNVTKEQADRREKNHRFMHDTFLEFLAACELVQQLASSESQLCLSAISWIAENKYDPYYQNILSFAAGLTNTEQAMNCWYGHDRDRALSNFWVGIRTNVDIVGKHHLLLLGILKRAMGTEASNIPSWSSEERGNEYTDVAVEETTVGTSLIKRAYYDRQFVRMFGMTKKRGPKKKTKKKFSNSSFCSTNYEIKSKNVILTSSNYGKVRLAISKTSLFWQCRQWGSAYGRQG